MGHGAPKGESGRYRSVVGKDAYSKQTAAAV